MAPTDRFRAAVQDAKVGPDKDIPHITPQIIAKYVSDLRLLGLLCNAQQTQKRPHARRVGRFCDCSRRCYCRPAVRQPDRACGAASAGMKSARGLVMAPDDTSADDSPTADTYGRSAGAELAGKSVGCGSSGWTSRAMRTASRDRAMPPKNTISAPRPEKYAISSRARLRSVARDRVADGPDPQQRGELPAHHEPGARRARRANRRTSRWRDLPETISSRPPTTVATPGNTSSQPRAVVHVQS